MMMPSTMILTICISIGAETIGHGWARAHPLLVSGGHRGGGEEEGGAQTKHIKHSLVVAF